MPMKPCVWGSSIMSSKKKDLIPKTLKLASIIAGNSGAALALAKLTIDKGAEANIETASIYEIDCFALCFTTLEQKRRWPNLRQRANND